MRRALGRAVGAGLALFLLPGAAWAQAVVRVNEAVAFQFGFLVQSWADFLQDPISGGYSQNLFLRRVRLIAAGSVARDVTFFFETDNSRLGNAGVSGAKNINTGLEVLDAFGEWRVFGNDRFILDMGKLVIPFTRNTLQGISTPLSLDAGTFTFQQNVGTESDSGRDVGIQLKSYLASEHLELRGGVFAGFRAPPGGGAAGSRNSPRWVGRVVYNFFDTEKGYISVGTNLGKRKILAIGAGYDTQGSFSAYGGDFMIDWPIGPADIARGQNAITAHVDYIRFDGGCGLTSTGTRTTDCLIPTLPKQDEIFTDLGFYSVALKLQPFVRFEWNGFVDSIDHARDSRRYMMGLNYYVLQQNFKITGAYERIVPNVASTGSSSKDTNHFVLQLQLFYF